MFSGLLKKISATILLLAFAAQTFSQGITLIRFYINRAYIVKNECINRYRPMLHCNGQCALAKKLKAQEKKEQQNPDLKMDARQEIVSSRSFFITIPSAPLTIENNWLLFNDSRTLDQPSSFFHPPGK
jgi:hypothetical protein